MAEDPQPTVVKATLKVPQVSESGGGGTTRTTPRSAGYGLRVPCKGWRGLCGKTPYKSPRYRHSSHAHVIRQQQRAAQRPNMKKGFPPCKQHTKMGSVAPVLYDIDASLSTAIYIRLSCIVCRIPLNEVIVPTAQDWPLEEAYQSPVLMYRGTLYRDVRSIYRLLSHLSAQKFKAAVQESRSWKYIGILHDLLQETSWRIGVDPSAPANEVMGQSIATILGRLEQMIKTNQSAEGYIFSKGVVTLVETFIAGVLRYCESLMGPDQWKVAGQCLPSLRKVKNLVYAQSTVQRWLQQKQAATCVFLADTWETKLVMKWLEMACVPYKKSDVSEQDWKAKFIQEYPLMPALLVPGSSTPPICGMHAIALWILHRQNSDPERNTVLEPERIWECLDQLTARRTSMITETSSDLLPDPSPPSLVHPNLASVSFTGGWLVDGATSVLLEELQNKTSSGGMPWDLEPARRRADYYMWFNERGLPREGIEVDLAQGAKDVGMEGAIKEMCRRASIPCHIASLSSQVATEKGVNSAVRARGTTFYGLTTVMLVVADICDMLPCDPDARRRGESVMSFIEDLLRHELCGVRETKAVIAEAMVAKMEQVARDVRGGHRYLLENLPTWVDIMLAQIYRAYKQAGTNDQNQAWPVLNEIDQLLLSH